MAWYNDDTNPMIEHNPKYLMENEKIQKGLKNLYDTYVSRILSDEIKFVPWWVNAPSKYEINDTVPYASARYNTQERCDLIAYKQMREISMNPAMTLRAETDKLVYKTKTIGTDKYLEEFDIMRKNLRPFILDTLLGLVNKHKGLDYTNMGMSNNPMLYKEYMGNRGYMGWHTNCDKPGHRWYLVYNTHDKQSYFRWIQNEQMYQIFEPKGWSINSFQLGDCDNELWHCIFSNKIRFSIGLWGGNSNPDVGDNLDSPIEQLKGGCF